METHEECTQYEYPSYNPNEMTPEEYEEYYDIIFDKEMREMKGTDFVGGEGSGEYTPRDNIRINVMYKYKHSRNIL